MRKTAVILAIFVAISSIVVAAGAPPIPGQDTDTADSQDQEAPPMPGDSEGNQTNNSQSGQNSTNSDTSADSSGGVLGAILSYLAGMF